MSFFKLTDSNLILDGWDIFDGVLLSSSPNYRHNVHNLMILMNLIIIIFAKSQYFDDLCQ